MWHCIWWSGVQYPLWSLMPPSHVNQMGVMILFLHSHFTPGWQWRSTSTSTPGWKDAPVTKWKSKWTRWLRMLVYHISARILRRTCQVCLYECVLWHLCDLRVSEFLVEIMQIRKSYFLCVYICAFISPEKGYHLWLIPSIQDKTAIVHLSSASACGCVDVRMHYTWVSQVVIHCLGGHEQVLLDKLSPVTDCLWAKSLKYDFQGWSMLTFPLH